VEEGLLDDDDDDDGQEEKEEGGAGVALACLFGLLYEGGTRTG